MYFYGYRQHQPHAFINKLKLKHKRHTTSVNKISEQMMTKYSNTSSPPPPHKKNPTKQQNSSVRDMVLKSLSSIIRNIVFFQLKVKQPIFEQDKGAV